MRDGGGDPLWNSPPGAGAMQPSCVAARVEPSALTMFVPPHGTRSHMSATPKVGIVTMISNICQETYGRAALKPQDCIAFQQEPKTCPTEPHMGMAKSIQRELVASHRVNLPSGCLSARTFVVWLADLKLCIAAPAIARLYKPTGSPIYGIGCRM